MRFGIPANARPYRVLRDEPVVAGYHLSKRNNFRFGGNNVHELFLYGWDQANGRPWVRDSR